MKNTTNNSRVWFNSGQSEKYWNLATDRKLSASEIWTILTLLTSAAAPNIIIFNNNKVC